jgi:hypothetical protein
MGYESVSMLLDDASVGFSAKTGKENPYFENAQRALTPQLAAASFNFQLGNRQDGGPVPGMFMKVRDLRFSFQEID